MNLKLRMQLGELEAQQEEIQTELSELYLEVNSISPSNPNYYYLKEQIDELESSLDSLISTINELQQ